MDNHGCLKCSHPFTHHVYKECLNNWPNAATYFTITTTDVTAAGKSGRIKNTSAAIIPANNNGTVSSSTVTAVIASHHMAYVTANMQSVIDENNDNTDSDDSLHCPPLCPAVISNVKIPSSTVKQIVKNAGLTPFFEPHLWCHCSTEASNFLPQMINTLIDPRSHMVLICEDLIKAFLLHHQPRHELETMELVMESNRKKSQIVL